VFLEETVTSVATQQIEFTRELIARNRAIVACTRHLMACNRRRLNPWWGLSGGSDEGDRAAELRLSLRQRLEQGDLVPTPRGVWAGMGTGQHCVVCARDIPAAEVQNEISVRADGLEVRLWAHLPCLTIWREESDAIQHDRSADPPAAQEGAGPSAALARAIRLAVKKCHNDVAQAVTEVLDWMMALPSRKGLALVRGLSDHSSEVASDIVRNALREAGTELHSGGDVPLRDRLVSAGDPDRAAAGQAEVRRQLYRPLIQLVLSELNRTACINGRKR
jgi:hypothetical protein